MYKFIIIYKIIYDSLTTVYSKYSNMNFIIQTLVMDILYRYTKIILRSCFWVEEIKILMSIIFVVGQNILAHYKGTFNLTIYFHCTLGILIMRVHAIYVSNSQSHGNFGILFAGHGRYPAVLNTQ